MKPLSDTELTEPPKSRPYAIGDFRTAETTIASRVEDDLFEVRLSARRPPWDPRIRYLAHFSLDEAVALQVSRELAHTISTYSARKLPPSGPMFPNTETLNDTIGTDVLFSEGDAPRVRVNAETGGDRIWINISTHDADVMITVQLDGAIALREFFAGRPLLPGTRVRW